jgi:hypothetical protein
LLTLGRFTLNLGAQVVDRHLELVEDGANDVAAGQRVQQVFCIHFTTLEINCGAGSLLKYFFCVLAEPFVGRCRAASTATGADRDSMAAAGLIAPEVVVDKVTQQAAIATE